jgi:hypothetical protein
MKLAGCSEDITPYFHSLVCAIPRQSECYELMDLSGQSLEALNQLLKRTSLTNRRYSKNKRTGAVPNKKMSVGMPQQIMSSAAAKLKTKGMMKGTQRQRKSEKVDERARKMLVVKSADEMGSLITKHNLG